MSSAKQVRVEMDGLQVGMYVTRLDRPWTETPFLFQGFFVRTPDEIEELRRYCKHVFIDTEQSGGSDKTSPKTSGRSDTTGGDRTITGVTSLRYPSPRQTTAGATRNRTVYTTAVPVEQEMKVARRAHADATKAAQEILTTLQNGGQLDMELAKQTVEPMVESVLRNPDAMIWLTRMRQHDSYSYHHSVGCSVWGIAFARHLGLDRQALYEVGLGCMLFDVGKTRLPQAMLSKPDKLTEAEWHVVRNHVQYSLNLLEGTSEVTQATLDLVRSHHERHDGSGYPDGLKENEIPTSAKIAGIVDSYDAITTPRPYSHLRSPYEAVREIYTWRGTLFQSEIVEQFMQVVG
ncbi:MAG: HD-GYP domain-containing protein, partial [bacterium]